MSFGTRSTPLGSYHASRGTENRLESIPVIPRCRNHDEVKLHVYKIDKTSAPIGCLILEGMSGKCVRHSAIVVFGCTYHFSQDGVEVHEETGKRIPEKVISLGRSEMSVAELNILVDNLRRNTFKPSTYDARSNNCHHFSNQLSLFMTDTQIPEEFLRMGDEVAQGAMTTAVIGAGALAVGGLAYHWYNSATRERELPRPQSCDHWYNSATRERELPRPQSYDGNGNDTSDTSLLGVLAAGAAGLAACLESSANTQQTQRQALGSSQWPTLGGREDSSDADAATELLKKLMNLGNK